MPNFYNPYQQYYQPTYQPIQTQPQQQSQSQIQNSGFISVPSEDVARNYPVAPGNSVTFKNENAPYVYTKTMGFSQLDRPSFEKYKLVKEETAEEELIENPNLVDELRSKIGELKVELDELRGEVDDLKSTKTAARRKKDGDVGHDE